VQPKKTVAMLVLGLTDGRLLVVAGHVVPLDTVRVKVVEHAQAGLGMALVLGSVVRLRSRRVSSSGV